MSNNLIFVQESNGFGGLEKITKDYEFLLKDFNPLVALVLYDKNGIQYNNYYPFRKKNKLDFVKEYLSFVRKRQQSIFHLQLTGTAILFLTYLGGARKIIYHVHGTYSKRNFIEKTIWKFLEKKIKIIANSNHTKNEILKKYGVKKNIFIIPNLINEKEFIFHERNYSGKKFIITYAGRFTKGKNLNLLIETAKVLNCTKNNIEIRIVGDGPEKNNLISRIKELSLENDVKILPFTDNISKIYQESHLFIFLSLFESFGNVVAEAILTGLPVLCYKIPSLTEFVKDDFFFFEKKEPELIARKIIEFKEDYQCANEKLKSTYMFLKDYLDNQKIINQLENLYKEFS